MAGGGQIGTTQALPGRGLGPIGPSGLTAKEGA
jgi:hypothetical protein